MSKLYPEPITQQQIVMETDAGKFRQALHALTMSGQWHVVAGTQMIHTYYVDPDFAGAHPKALLSPAMAVYMIVVEREVSAEDLQREAAAAVDEAFETPIEELLGRRKGGTDENQDS